MQVRLNGDPVELPDGLSVEALVARLGLAGKRLAVEVDGAVVPRSAHPSRVLQGGERVEIIHAIGGG
jgi:sulfur carrier protein